MLLLEKHAFHNEHGHSKSSIDLQLIPLRLVMAGNKPIYFLINDCLVPWAVQRFLIVSRVI